jgi:hypothetical protein
MEVGDEFARVVHLENNHPKIGTLWIQGHTLFGEQGRNTKESHSLVDVRNVISRQLL